MFVYGGMWLLVGHLCSRWGEVFVTLGEGGETAIYQLVNSK